MLGRGREIQWKCVQGGSELNKYETLSGNKGYIPLLGLYQNL